MSGAELFSDAFGMITACFVWGCFFGVLIRTIRHADWS